MITALAILLAVFAAPDAAVQPRHHAPTGLGVACRTPGVEARALAIYDQVETALWLNDYETAMAALGPADPQAAEWLSILCAAHDVAAREHLSLRARKTMRASAIAAAETLRDHAEAFLAAHAVAPMATKRDDADVPPRKPTIERTGCQWGCEPATLNTFPPRPACLCPDGMVSEPQTRRRAK